MIPNPTIFGFEIQLYSFFHYAGLFAAYLFGYCYYKKQVNDKMENKKVWIFLITMPFVALIGSRIFGLWEIAVGTGAIPDFSNLWLNPTKGRFRWCGSVIALLLFLPLFSKWMKAKNFHSFFDTVAISLCLLTVFTKQGCQFSGDGCYGIFTTLPWGAFYPYGPAPNILPVHPTPVYDSLFHLVLMFGLIAWDKKKSFDGQTAMLYFIVAPLFYILLEVIRLNPKTAIGLTVPQITFAATIIIALFYYKQIRELSNMEKVGLTP